MPAMLVLLKPPESLAFHRAVAELTSIHPSVSVRLADSIESAMELIGEAEILLTLPPHLGDDGARLLAAAKRLKWVQLISTGADGVVEHLAETDVLLTSARGLHGAQMSEAALAAMLSLARQIPRIVRDQDAARWRRFPARLLAGKSVGILGMGAIADTLAPLLKALGMTVVGITGTTRAIAHVDEVRLRGDLPAAVGDLDYLILLAPYSAETAGIVDARVFAAMKPDACLVNLARGGIVDEPALLDALDRGLLAGAALDVFAHEPLAPDSPFWRHERVIVTAHLGGLHEGYASDVLALTRDNLGRYLAGEPLINRVDTRPREVSHAAE